MNQNYKSDIKLAILRLFKLKQKLIQKENVCLANKKTETHFKIFSHCTHIDNKL